MNPQLKTLSKVLLEDGTIKSTAFEKFDEFLTEAKSIRLFRCYEDALTIYLKSGQKQTRIWKSQGRKWTSIPIYQAELHPYQKKGVAFAVEQAGL